MKPIVLATLRPPASAHMLAPLPRWSTTVLPAAARVVVPRQRLAMYSYESPWKP